MQPATVIPINEHHDNAELVRLRIFSHEIREALGLGPKSTDDECLKKILEMERNERHSAMMQIRAENRVPKTKLGWLMGALRVGR